MGTLKIKFKTIEDLDDLKQQAKELYTEIDEMVAKIYNSGDTNFVYETDQDDEGHHYIRIKLIDSTQLLADEEVCYKITAYKPIELETRRRKKWTLKI